MRVTRIRPARYHHFQRLGGSGGCTRTRTLDPLIKSQLLYQLSYAPIRRKCSRDGGRTRTRTLDPLIKSQLLYQLSYAPIS